MPSRAGRKVPGYCLSLAHAHLLVRNGRRHLMVTRFTSERFLCEKQQLYRCFRKQILGQLFLSIFFEIKNSLWTGIYGNYALFFNKNANDLSLKISSIMIMVIHVRMTHSSHNYTYHDITLESITRLIQVSKCTYPADRGGECQDICA